MHNSELSELFDSSSTIKFVDEDDSSSRSRRGKRDADLDRVNQQIEIYKLKISKEKNRIQTLNEQLIRQSMSSSVRRGGGDSKSNKDRETKIDTEKQLLCDRLNNKVSLFIVIIAPLRKPAAEIVDLLYHSWLR